MRNSFFVFNFVKSSLFIENLLLENVESLSNFSLFHFQECEISLANVIIQGVFWKNSFFINSFDSYLSFISNELFSNEKKFLSTVIFVENIKNIYILSSIFSNNTFYTSSVVSSATCITAKSVRSSIKKISIKNFINFFWSLKINSSKFETNRADYYPNCIFFEGFDFFLSYSLFSNNVPYGIYSSVSSTAGFGGCFELIGTTIYMKFNQFLHKIKRTQVRSKSGHGITHRRVFIQTNPRTQ